MSKRLRTLFPFGLGLALLAGCGGSSTGALVPAQTPVTARASARAASPGAGCPVVSSSQNFNNVAIPPGSWIWFTSVISMPRGSGALDLRMTNSRIFFGNGSTYYLVKASPMLLSLDASARLVLEDPRNGPWRLIAPERTSGNDLLAGLAFYVRNGLPGGAKNVTWSAQFYSKSARPIRWQWSAAAYSTFTKRYERLEVKPLDDRHYPPYNSDRAGTPERYKEYVIGGATGTGGSNYTGGLSARVTVTPCK